MGSKRRAKQGPRLRSSSPPVQGFASGHPRPQASMVEAGHHKAAPWWQLLLMTAPANDTASVPPASGPGRPQAVGSHRPAPPLPLSRTTMTGCGRGTGQSWTPPRNKAHRGTHQAPHQGWGLRYPDGTQVPSMDLRWPGWGLRHPNGVQVPKRGLRWERRSGAQDGGQLPQWDSGTQDGSQAARMGSQVPQGGSGAQNGAQVGKGLGAQGGGRLPQGDYGA